MQPKITTNESYIQEIGATGLKIEEPRAVFGYILKALPDEVTVYPTENYYYFYFFQDGVRYTGNIRLAIDLRDQGLVAFNYFREATPWQQDDKDHYRELGKKDGVAIQKVSDLVYRISADGESVTFKLNDLSNVKPPALAEGEVYLGPIFDESGIRFFFVFDETRKLFRYILDETVPVADELMEADELPHVSLGRRTGFAFFDDPVVPRKILVGVYEGNARMNTAFDGPFDQLPDNFLKGDELRRAILLADPDADPNMDRLGNRPGGQERELIDPYKRYENVSSLRAFGACAENASADWTYRCLDALFEQ
ncbi:hypothetical protein IZ6_04780 [Terrihabitans soli]|uniref:Uncharacterized protein n=1 Tax=Terrihabitans soli TaxID=708113 RepID=A0A6S6QF90_9HYPH|nr:hypothetical protein [Terrihabitans soli]BCJ89743.1 hypothetical protein IZ6_04780 [Terrihabitans soli]